MDRLEQFLNFAEQSPTAFHAAAGFREMLRNAGFEELRETAWACAWSTWTGTRC